MVVTKSVSVVVICVATVVLLGLAGSMNWVCFTEKSETTTEPKMVQVPNRVQTPLTKESVDKWGAIPGEFNSTYMTKFEFSSFDADFLSTESIGRTLKKAREGNTPVHELWQEMIVGNATSLAYNISKASQVEISSSSSEGNELTYRTKNTFNTTGVPLDDSVTTVNYDALSFWWQMENLPSYLRSWQAMSQIGNKLRNQDFLTFYYANQMYAAYFSDYIWVQQNVLLNFTEEERDAIYFDKYYGFDSIRNMTMWVKAVRGAWGAEDALRLHYWSGTSLRFTDEQLENLIWSGGALAQKMQELEQRFVDTGFVAENGEVSDFNYGTYQWMNNTMLNDPELGYTEDSTYYAYRSVQDIQMSFLTPPEIALSGCPVNFTHSQAKAIFQEALETEAGTVFDDVSFMSPVNIFDFDRFVEAKNWQAIEDRWTFTQAQSQCLDTYIKIQGAYNTYQVNGNLMTFTLHDTYWPIERSVARDITAKMIAYYNALAPSTYTCEYVFSAATNATRAAEICAARPYNFTDPVEVYELMAGPWYKNMDMAQIMNITGLNETEYWAFYDPTNLMSFGNMITTELVELSEWYHCPDTTKGNANFTTNCSSNYLAAAQWGGSLITHNPPVQNSSWFPVSLTLMDWALPNFEKAYEYYYYSDTYNVYTGNQTPNLTAWQVGNITNDDYTHFGLESTYNGKMLYQSYSTLSVSNPNEYLSAVGVAFQMSNQELYDFIGTLEVVTEQVTLGGLQSIHSVGDVMFGFQSALIQKHNDQFPSNLVNYTDGAWTYGNAILYNPEVAPMMTSNTTNIANMTVTVTVNSTDNTTGRVEMINGQNYPNQWKEVLVGNGSSVLLPFRCSNVDFTNSDVYTWMQNEPDVMGKSTISTLNLDSLMVQEAPNTGDSSICVEGTGESCQYSLDANVVQIYDQTSQITEVNRCTQLLPLGGTGYSQNQVDATSGLSTNFEGDVQNTIDLGSLMSIVPGTTRKAHLHPFISLRMLHQALGDTPPIPLSSMVDSFTVEPQAFITKEYPLNVTEPYNTVQNGTIEVTHENKVAEAGVLVVFIILIVICLVVILFFCKACTTKTEKEGNFNDDDTITPLTAGGNNEVVNFSNEESIASMRDKSC